MLTFYLSFSLFFLLSTLLLLLSQQSDVLLIFLMNSLLIHDIDNMRDSTCISFFLDLDHLCAVLLVGAFIVEFFLIEFFLFNSPW